MTEPINLTELRAAIELGVEAHVDGYVTDITDQMLALIDTAEAATAYWQLMYPPETHIGYEDFRSDAQKLRDRADQLDRESAARQRLRESLARYTKDDT